MVAARAAVAVVAVVVLAWLAVMERDARLLASGVATAGRATNAHRFESADADFRAARLLNPDTAPDLGRALLYDGAGRPRAAAAILEGVLRREPDNLTAWGLRYSVAQGAGDRAGARRALAARRRLDPVNAR